VNIRARAPGRVNLIGDHTDYTGGLVLPMAIDRWTTVEGSRGGDTVRLSSNQVRGEASVPLAVKMPAVIDPPWAALVAGVVASFRPDAGFQGTVRSTIPMGAGLSSSAAFAVALALAIGFDGAELQLASTCQRAEQIATGVPCGVMDQLASVAGVAEHALLIDCTTLSISPVPLPDVEVVVVHSGASRQLAGTAYAQRRAECEAAARLVGPLRDAKRADVESITDPVLRRRARHVVSENERVLACAAALCAGDVANAGNAMIASHASLRDDFAVSTPVLDELVERLLRIDGVIGARLTGAGFGGCVVALAHSGAAIDGWHVRAVDGASVEVTE
jgi:galactokinase